jgi:hypothetical protein
MSIRLLTSGPSRKLPQPNIHRRLPPLQQRQPRVDRPLTPHPASIQINPKQCIATPRDKPRASSLCSSYFPSPPPLTSNVETMSRLPYTQLPLLPNKQRSSPRD